MGAFGTVDACHMPREVIVPDDLRAPTEIDQERETIGQSV
jgi:hypothetical protein